MARFFVYDNDRFLGESLTPESARARHAASGRGQRHPWRPAKIVDGRVVEYAGGAGDRGRIVVGEDGGS